MLYKRIRELCSDMGAICNKGIRPIKIFIKSLFPILILLDNASFSTTTANQSSINNSDILSRFNEHFLSGDEFNDLIPTVNKCCPLHLRYANGNCTVPNNFNGSDVDFFESSLRSSPRTLVTLARDFQNFNQSEVDEIPIVFRLNFGQPNCSEKKLELTNSNFMSAEDNSVLALSPNGYLLWSDKGYDHQIKSDDFCIDQHSQDSTYVAVFCMPICNERRPCVRKCCRPEMILFNNTCKLSTEPWQPFLYEEPQKIARNLDLPHYKIGVPNCDYYSISLRDDPSEKAYLLLNGTLVMDANGKKIYYDPETFCIDGSLSTAYANPDTVQYIDNFEIVQYSGEETDQTVIICYPPINENHEQPENWRLMLYAAVMLVSSFFLLLTALVFLILWEYQNIHGWLQFCYVISLLFAYTFLAVVQLSSQSIQEISSVCCKMIGALIHFLFLSAFFWLTSMNFDLWWTFSGCRPMRASNVSGDKRRFFSFAAFSYLVPGLIATVGLVLDSFYRDNPNIITPRFGEKKCYFSGDKEKLPYFYGPVGFLLTVNSVFFISTIYSLHKLQNDTKFATKQSSRQEKQRFLLFMKLFVVMGVLWIFEVISWATMMLNEKDLFWMNVFLPTDLLISAQGIAIFLIFTCKANTCRQVETQLKRFSLYIQLKRDESDVASNNVCSMFKKYLLAAVCLVVVPTLNWIRLGLGCCCQVTRKLDARRQASHTNTLTSAIWDKSRKVSEISATTMITNVDMELDLKSNRRDVAKK